MRLIEIIVAMAIFAAVITMSLEGVIGIRRYADVDRTERTLEIEGKRAMDRIGAELVNSAWTPSTQTPTVNGSTFPRIAKNLTQYGDSMSFYKLRTEAEIVSNAPTSLRIDNVAFDNFSLPGNKPSLMSEYWKARPVSSLVLNGAWVDNGSPNPPAITSVVWETAQPQNNSSTSAGQYDRNYNANLDLTKLRQYRLTVIIDAATGLGILVKQWRNTGSTVDTDWPAAVIGTNAIEIVRDVVSVAFDSYLTETDERLARLNPYQLRVDLVLASAYFAGSRVNVVNGVALDASGNSTGGGGLVRNLSATYTLRSVTDPTL